MSPVNEEISSQPRVWRQAVELAASPAVAAVLPAHGERVAFAGCGTSLYMSQVCASLREVDGHGPTDAWPASEFAWTREYDRVVVISRSGTTTEVRELVRALKGAVPTTAIVADASQPLIEEADDGIVLDFADEQAVVQTRFATSVIALWRAHLGHDLTDSIAATEQALADDLPSAAVESSQFTFLGRGWHAALANEAALKLREAAQAWAESYPSMEFRHGPISVIDASSTVWIFGEPPVGLVDQLQVTGANIVSGGDPLASLVNAQRLAVALAERRGLDPGSPRNLTRSIILD